MRHFGLSSIKPNKLFSDGEKGTYDAILSSHVFEHLTFKRPFDIVAVATRV